MITHTRSPVLLAAGLILSAAMLVVGCETAPTAPEYAEGNEAVSVDEAIAAKAFGRTDGTVAVPFEATFVTTGGLDFSDGSCGAHPLHLNVQDGAGEGAHLGRFDVHITFCADVTDFLNDLQLTEGESVPYDRGVGTFTAASGDELSFTISGAVVPSDHPDYDFEFADPFEFSGGTGRFEGAGGSGVTSSFVDAEAGRTDHHWSGTLILNPGF